MNTELHLPAPGRVCSCGETMIRARSSSLRWRCPRCKRLSDRDPYLESIRDEAPRLPLMQPEPSSEPIRRWVLTFVGAPPSPNAALTLRERMRTAKLWREMVAESARHQGIPSLERVRLSAVFYRRNLGVADEDNDRARLKRPLDGLVRAGVLPKDTRKHVEWGEVREERGPSGFALVIEALA